MTRIPIRLRDITIRHIKKLRIIIRVPILHAHPPILRHRKVQIKRKVLIRIRLVRKILSATNRCHRAHVGRAGVIGDQSGERRGVVARVVGIFGVAGAVVDEREGVVRGADVAVGFWGLGGGAGDLSCGLAVGVGGGCGCGCVGVVTGA